MFLAQIMCMLTYTYCSLPQSFVVFVRILMWHNYVYCLSLSAITSIIILILNLAQVKMTLLKQKLRYSVDTRCPLKYMLLTKIASWAYFQKIIFSFCSFLSLSISQVSMGFSTSKRLGQIVSILMGLFIPRQRPSHCLL